MIDSFGNLLGTTLFGGGYDYDYQGLGGGIVFQLKGFTNIHSFCSEGQWDCLDGGYVHGLVMDKTGNLYGVTEIGGSLYGGTIFELAR